MRPPIYKNPNWNNMLEWAGILLILLVVGNLLFSDYLQAHELLAVFLEIVEMFLILVVFLDLTIKLSYAHKRYTFLRNNALKFIAAFPFTFFVKSLKLFHIYRFVPRLAVGELLTSLATWNRLTNAVGKLRGMLRFP